MAKTQKQITGTWGEEKAVEHLRNKGYSIIEQNHREGNCELDIIAKKDDFLVIVEVKTRKSNTFGFPENSLDSRKKKALVQAIEAYIFTQNWKGNLRMDVIAITQKPSLKIEHFEDVLLD